MAGSLAWRSAKVFLPTTTDAPEPEVQSIGLKRRRGEPKKAPKPVKKARGKAALAKEEEDAPDFVQDTEAFIEIEELDDVDVVWEEQKDGSKVARLVPFAKKQPKKEAMETAPAETLKPTVLPPKKQKALQAPKKEAEKSGKQVTFGENKSVSTEALTSWRPLDLHPHLLDGLAAVGFTTPTDIQRRVIPVAKKGERDILGQAQTGSGKTLAFVLPILDRLYRQADSAGEVKQGLKALLLCPTRELAQQVEKHIAQVTAPHRRLRTVLLIGGISLEKQRRLLSKAPDVIVATPGRFWHWLDEENDRHLRALKTSLQFLVIDEVDRMLQGGHFAELEHIFQFIKDEKMAQLQTMVFSATLTNTSQPSGKPSSMEEWLASVPFRTPGDYMVIRVGSGTADKVAVPSTITETFIKCTEDTKDAYLWHLLQQKGQQKVIVFVQAITTLRRLVPLLQLLGLNGVQGMHAQLQQRQRLKIMDRFRSASSGVLVASDVAGRGLDFPDVDVVIQYNVARARDDYVHRTGRTGRAGRSGECITLISPKEDRAWQALQKQLSVASVMNEHWLDRRALSQARAAVLAATEQEAQQHREKKTKFEDAWVKKMMEEADMVLSD